MRTVYRFTIFLFLLVTYIIFGLVLNIAGLVFPIFKKASLYLLSIYSGFFLRRLNFNINVNRSGAVDSTKPYFAVCNHMSYLDILILCSVYPMRFVTSVEMKNTFFLGFLTMLGGSVYTERRNPKKLKQENGKISSVFDSGDTIAVFPEGTSTNGSSVLDFKSSLFQAPVSAGVDVLPICLKYEKINDSHLSDENCDYVCWYGDMTFFPSLIRLLTVDNVNVTVELMQPVSVKNHTRKEVAKISETMIRKKYEPVRKLYGKTSRSEQKGRYFLIDDVFNNCIKPML